MSDRIATVSEATDIDEFIPDLSFVPVPLRAEMKGEFVKWLRSYDEYLDRLFAEYEALLGEQG